VSNVIAFRKDSQRSRSPLHNLVRTFFANRRQPEDVFWLKENAEALNILAATGVDLDEETLAPFRPFYADLAQRLRDYPQYYRFFLSICLDLEDLGAFGTAGAALCDWAAREGLPGAELSDLQRAEARLLLARRGAARVVRDDPLMQRLRAFIERPQTFAIPNRKAAYELTHIVFYLSSYGRTDPHLGKAAVRSLEYTGLQAFLEQNLDLLAEVCIALRMAGRPPVTAWERAVGQAHRAISVRDEPNELFEDDYHLYLVTGWAVAAGGGEGFAHLPAHAAPRFRGGTAAANALRPIWRCLSETGRARNGDWGVMRARVMRYLDAESHALLVEAERSTTCFGSFFEGFARATKAG
jgi:hypothetical protein